MKKSLNFLLCFSLVACFSMNLSAQTDEGELDQLALLKQFAGSWMAETGVDSMIHLTYEPAGEGFLITQENMAGGAAYWTVKAVIGVSSDKKTIVLSAVVPDGSIRYQYGKFVSDKKCVMESYRDHLKYPMNIQEFEFLTPDSFSARGKYRGEKMTWDAEWWDPVTFNRVKE